MQGEQGRFARLDRGTDFESWWQQSLHAGFIEGSESPPVTGPRLSADGRLLGIAQPFLRQTSDVVIDLMGDAYPALRTQRDEILDGIEAEEEKFARTLEAGSARLSELVAAGLAGRKTATSGLPEPGEVADEAGAEDSELCEDGLVDPVDGAAPGQTACLLRGDVVVGYGTISAA